MKCSGKRIIIFFLIVFTFISTVSAAEIDTSVEHELQINGYAHVIVFVQEPLSNEVQMLLAQEEKDSATLKKILAEKKAVIRKQQQKVFRELEISSKMESDVDLVLEDKFQYINGFSGILTKDGYEKLKYDNAVIGIYSNEELQIMLDTATPFVRAPFAEQITFQGTAITGEGIGICVIDTGVDATHPALEGTIADQYCYCSQGTGCCPNNLTEDTMATDDNGHGTGVIGTIVSQDSLYRGIAPGAQIVAIKAFSSTGSGTMSDVIAGIGKCLEKADDYNIKVFSFSFGGTTYPGVCDDDALASVTNDLANMGFIVVAASGNNGDSTKISTPACGSNVTSVGAVYDNSSTLMDTVVSFSNANAELDLLAPGITICTPKAQSAGGTICHTDAMSGLYKIYSGTSFSAPFVAGAAALVAQYNVIESEAFNPENIILELKSYGQPVLDTRNGLLFPRIDIENTLKHIDHTAPFLEVTAINNSRNVTITATVRDAINDIVLCKLYIAGVNETMMLQGTGRNITCTLEKQITENTNYIVYAMDANGNLGSKEETIEIANTAPIIVNYSPENTTITVPAPENITFFVEATDADRDVLSYWWILNTSLVSSESSYIFPAETAGTYILSALVSDGFANTSIQWTITVTELKIPKAYNVSINPAIAYRNQNLTCSYDYTGSHAENGTILQWYLNYTFYKNTIDIPKEELFVGETWNCSITASDGIFVSDAVYSSAVTIQNHAPVLSASDVAVAKTELVKILYTTFDEDNDTVTVSLNDSRFTEFSMNTTTTETFDVLLSATDGYDSIDKIVRVTVYDNQTDDDNDGIPNTIDKINGTIDGFNVYVDGVPAGNIIQDDELTISLTKNDKTIVTFDFDFSSEILSLTSAEITQDESANGNIVIKGLDVESKIVYIDALNSSATGMCIQDVEYPNFITQYCTGPHETFVLCNGSVTDDYTCSFVDERYMITGLRHSAIIQKCIDTDNDVYGLGCSAGNDCDDSNPAITPVAPEIYDNGIDDNCDGSSATTPPPTTTTTVAKAAGGGGGAGPSISETETVTETIPEEPALEVEQILLENNIPDTEKPADTDFLTEPLITPTDLSGITGAAITEITSGKLTGSVFSLIFMLLLCCGLLAGSGYYAIKHKRIHEQIDFFSSQEALKTIYEGIKDLFKR